MHSGGKSYLQQHTHTLCMRLIKHHRGAKKHTSSARLQTPYSNSMCVSACVKHLGLSHTNTHTPLFTVNMDGFHFSKQKSCLPG